MVAIEPVYRIQDMDDGPGQLAPADEGKYLMVRGGVFVVDNPPVASGGETRVIVGGRNRWRYIQSLDDGPGTMSAADDGKALVWNNATRRYIMATVSGGDATTLGGAPASYFEVAGAASSAMAAHLADPDPHTQYLLDTQYTAADVLTKMLAVDGAGSGLDADLLDGNSSAAFLLATGATTGATSQAQAFTNGVITGKVYPSSNTTNAVGFYRANGTTQDIWYDSTNGNLYVGALSASIYKFAVTVNSGAIDALLVRNSDGKVFWGAAGFAIGGSPYPLSVIHDGSNATITNTVGEIRIFNTAASAVKVRTNNIERFRIDATDNGVSSLSVNLNIVHTDSGTPAAGFGTGLRVGFKSSTTADQAAGRLTWEWDVATHASRASRGKLSAYYTSTERVCIDWKADSSGPLIGFLGTAPVARPTAYTQTYSTAARTVAAYTTDAENVAYTGIDNAQAGTVYAQLTDLNFLRVAYENLRASHDGLLQVVNSIIDDNQAYGLFA